MITQARLTYPECGITGEAETPTAICQFFYDCTDCGALLRPKEFNSGAYHFLWVVGEDVPSYVGSVLLAVLRLMGWVDRLHQLAIRQHPDHGTVEHQQNVWAHGVGNALD